MSRITVLLALLVLMVALCAIVPAHAATTWQVTKVTNYAVDMFPAADENGRFVASMGNFIYSINRDGSYSFTGTTGFCPTRIGPDLGLAYYNTAGLPVIGSTTPESSWVGSPYVSPCVRQSDKSIAFASGGDNIVMVTNQSGHIYKYKELFDPALWTIASTSWAPDDTLYVIAQDRWDSKGYGYHLFDWDTTTGAMTDLGKGYSEISVSGNKALMTSYDHSSITAWTWTPTGLEFDQNISYAGVSYWNIGRGYDGRFAALDYWNKMYEIKVVPEPGSMLALMTGIAGLGGFVLRRRRQ